MDMRRVRAIHGTDSVMTKHACLIQFLAITCAGEALHFLQAEQHLGLGPQASAVRRPGEDL